MKEFVEFHSNKNPRLRLFYKIFGLLFVTLIIGLGWRQLVKHDDYEEQEEKQILRRIIQPGPRGEIYDRDGRLLVGNRPVFSAAVYLGELRLEFEREYFKRVRTLRDAGLNVNRDKLRQEARMNVIERYIEPVNKILGRKIEVDPKQLDQYFRQRLLLPMPIAKGLSVFEYALLTEQLPVESPVQVLVESARYYPYGSLAAHVIGYVSSTDDVPEDDVPGKNLRTFSFQGKTGRNGLEKSFNEHLEGKSGAEIWIVDPKGFQYQNVQKKTPVKGQPLTCSIDVDLQKSVEDAIAGKTAAVVALDVETGEVLAMASTPTFDLNDLTPSIPTSVYEAINEQGGWLNRAVQGFYPPASPFKIVTAIAALRAGTITPEETFECGNSYLVGNRLFPEHSNTSFGEVNLEKAIQVSSNVYFYPLALKVGPELIAREARNFQFHKPTGIELPYEGTRMIVPDPDWKMKRLGESWLGGDTANMAIGQGFLLTTPLQMTCFAASFARNETHTHPTLVHDPTHNRGNHHAKPIGLCDANYQAIINGLKRCAEIGSAHLAKVHGMPIAAKTGTGQIRHKGQKRTVPWFFGFAPADDPKIALSIIIEGEDDSLWGKSTCPIAHVILSTYYQKYIKPRQPVVESDTDAVASTDEPGGA